MSELRILIAAEAAQQLMDRLAGRLAEEIPERDIDGGEAAHLRAAAAETDIGRAQGVGVLVDPQGILAQQIGRHAFMDVSRNRIGAEEGLAQADQPFIRMHLHPAKIGELGQLDRFDRRAPSCILL